MSRSRTIRVRLKHHISLLVTPCDDERWLEVLIEVLKSAICSSQSAVVWGRWPGRGGYAQGRLQGRRRIYWAEVRVNRNCTATFAQWISALTTALVAAEEVKASGGGLEEIQKKLKEGREYECSWSGMEIEEAEAALRHLRETPLREDEDPFWRYTAEMFLCSAMERLKAEDKA